MTQTFQECPHPDGGWSVSLEDLRDALVLPAETRGFVQPLGIRRSDGSYCNTGAYWRNARPLSTEPPLPDNCTPAKLEGRWLWGGVLWRHFGHFLVESTGRLWGLDATERPPEGIVYVGKRPRSGNEIRDFQRAFWSLCGIDLQVKVIEEPTEVAELIVPGQGFGLGPIISGTEPFRGFISRRFGSYVEPDGSERLYISRANLGSRKGGLIGEERIERLLAAEGYEIFHPEKHDLHTQVARYKAAKKVLAVEGSALHLFAMCGRPHQQVGIILRRQSVATNQILRHLQSFAGITPHRLDALRNVYERKGGHKSRHDLGVPDLPRLERLLAEAGFVSGTADWPDLRWRYVKKIIGNDYDKRSKRRTSGTAESSPAQPASAVSSISIR
ncbi:glycosyltransferase family 61 protein [Litorisediminicola beolgyonensis]|uniref:Glycosyltransferase family 61 protein n=1 Tax=Litorisediminicola beolgyonensis TaxID=1173614 RepID=A0ABW3ZG97_9RHOB